MHAENTDSPSCVPARLSALVLMVAGVLALFVLVNRLDALIKLLSEPGAPAQAVEAVGAPTNSDGHIITTLGDADTAEPAPDRTGGSPTGLESTGQPAAPPDLPSDTPAEGEETSPSEAPQHPTGEDDPVICPSRPGRGSRMSQSPRTMAERPRVPTQGRDEEPDRPESPSYVAGPSDPATTPPARNYTIRDGDTLWRIATEVYGSGEAYRAILQANPDLDAQTLPVGKQIRLPARQDGAQLARRPQD